MTPASFYRHIFFGCRAQKDRQVNLFVFFMYRMVDHIFSIVISLYPSPKISLAEDTIMNAEVSSSFTISSSLGYICSRDDHQHFLWVHWCMPLSP